MIGNSWGVAGVAGGVTELLFVYSLHDGVLLSHLRIVLGGVVQGHPVSVLSKGLLLRAG